jgi:hypothetical protein
MSLPTTLAVAALCCFPLGAASAMPSAASPPRTIDAFGLWPLTRLGVAQPIELDPTLADPTATVPFRFPPHARQGPAGWYLGHLHASVRFAAVPGAVGFLDASVNRWEWAQIRIRSVRRHGTVYTVWDCATVLGHAAGSSKGLTAHISFLNFLTIGSVRPGDATLRFSVERYHGAVLQKVVVGRNTAIEYSKRGPARLELRLSAPSRAVRGRRFAVAVHLMNAGDRPLHDVKMNWDYPRAVVRLVARSAGFDGSLRAHESAAIRFWFAPLRKGTARLELLAGGSGGAGNGTAVVKIV